MTSLDEISFGNYVSEKIFSIPLWGRCPRGHAVAGLPSTCMAFKVLPWQVPGGAIEIKALSLKRPLIKDRFEERLFENLRYIPRL